MHFRNKLFWIAALSFGAASTGMASEAVQSKEGLPMVVDVGSKYCVPCKMMVPVLENISKRYEGRVEVRFIDIRENPKAAEELDVHIIPTQIFFDRAGEEVHVHVGFMGEEEMSREIEKLLR